MLHFTMLRMSETVRFRLDVYVCVTDFRFISILA